MLLRRGDLKNSWLLAPGEVLEGTRLATVRLRPVRAALLVPERSAKAAAAAVEACCISWGEFANCIIPYSKDEGIRGPWREIVETLDPDLFVCFEGAPPEEVADYARSRGYRQVFPHESEGLETLVTGTPIYSALDSFMDSRDIERKSRPLVLPLYRGFPEGLLPFQARYGSMLEAASFRDEKYVHNLLERHGAQLRATHRDFFDVRECEAGEHYDFEVPKMISEVFVGDLSRLLPEYTEDAETRTTTLPEVTLAGIIPMTRGPLAGAASPAESRKYDDRVMVLGDYSSVEDLALFWTLRSMRPGGHPFPIWLPYRHVYDDRAKQLIESASRELTGRRRHSGGSLHITSASLGLDYLEETFRPLFPEADITTDIADFVGGTTDYYVVEERQPVPFVEGTTHVRKIRPPKMARLQPDFDHVVHEVEIEGVKLPPVKAVEETVFGVPGRGNRVLTERGGIRTVDPHNTVYPGKDYLEIRFPDGGRLLEAFFDHYGYECLPTAKSRAALGQMGLLGGVEGINVVANSKVYGALKDLCATNERDAGNSPRPYRADRKAEPYNYFTNAFGNRSARPILDWLVENRLLLRGSNIPCPHCRLELWYPVDRVGERWMCDGCREEMPIPIKPDALHWRYRVNELWANGQDQGTVTPLLALYAMCARWGSTFAREGFGYYPGVELKRSEVGSVPVDHIELDLVALYGGKPVLVECKESAKHLWTPEGADEFAVQLMDQIKLAEHVGARKVIVASPSRFPEDKSRLMSKVPAESDVEVAWWDDEVLLDPLYLAGDMKANDAQKEGQGMIKPIDKMKDRIEVARDESDVVLFYDLMKLGELVIKTATSGLIAAVEEDRERNRYRLLHSLVRANGVGDWSRAAEDATKSSLTSAAQEEQNQLTQQKNMEGSWQQEALSLLDECFVHLDVDNPQNKVSGLQWLRNFATLRNKTPVGHGAQLSVEQSLPEPRKVYQPVRRELPPVPTPLGLHIPQPVRQISSFKDNRRDEWLRGDRNTWAARNAT